jgi:hypothetical protein
MENSMRSALSLVLMFAVSTLAASQKSSSPKSDLPVTASILDFDASNVPYFIQSDGLGSYQSGVSGVQSVLQTSANYAWLLNTYNSSFTASAGRNAVITLTPANQQSATAKLPSFWTSWGTYLEPARFITQGVNCPLLTIRPGSPIHCPLLIRFGPATSVGKGIFYYRLDMTHGLFNDPESQEVQVSCNAVNSAGNCYDWFVDSAPPLSENGGVATNRVVAQLTKVTSQSCCLSFENEGDFYLTFHIRVTNP